MPRDYPHRAVAWVKHFPVVLAGAAAAARFLGLQEKADQLDRLRRFGREGMAFYQREVFEAILPYYPGNTRFVVLPMDLGLIGHGPVMADIREQHDELAALARDPRHGPRVIPFATLFPDRPGAVDEFRRCIEEHGFRGLKLYPKLGYAPDHPVLMNHVYPYCEANGLPVVSHCSRGGVRGADVTPARADAWSAPQAFIPVLDAFPKLRVNLAHFGGLSDWQAYVEEGIHPDDPEAGERNWQVAIRRMLCARAPDGGPRYPGLWTDISYTVFQFDDYVPFLKLFLADPAIRGRVLFGSDFYMTRQERLSERAVCFRLRAALGDDLFRQIAETNPRVWLGEADG